ncbi:hypothetical protein [Streptomyces canus]|uniref:hypothetical protein n=1 Tax=Streptomyces canus TaxID=58343 RepID=UPI000AED87A6|nr:hypothetical protein [Streptomyces canus]
MNPPNAVEVNRLLKRNYSILIRGFLLRLVIFGALCATPVVLAKTGTWDSPVLAVLSVAGILGFVLMAYRFPFALLSLRRCGMVLKEYPLEFRSGMTKKSESRTKYGTVFTVRVKADERGGSPLMRAVDALERHRWPEGAEGGVWFAGDLPFGGVVVVPHSETLLVVRPQDWDKFAPEREQADADRVEKAKRTGLAQRVR